MIQMCMSQQYIVNAGGVKAERFGVLLVQLAAALIHPAVDQDPLPGAFNQMTGTSDVAIRSVKGYFQVTLPCTRSFRPNGYDRTDL